MTTFRGIPALHKGAAVFFRPEHASDIAEPPPEYITAHYGEEFWAEL
jgi:hypothetical protein